MFSTSSFFSAFLCIPSCGLNHIKKEKSKAYPTSAILGFQPPCPSCMTFRSSKSRSTSTLSSTLKLLERATDAEEGGTTPTASPDNHSTIITNHCITIIYVSNWKILLQFVFNVSIWFRTYNFIYYSPTQTVNTKLRFICSVKEQPALQSLPSNMSNHIFLPSMQMEHGEWMIFGSQIPTYK